MLAPSQAPARSRPGARRHHRPLPPRRRRPNRVRRVILLAGAMCLVPALVSFVSYMVQPSNSSFFINSVEWLRDNGARGIVNSIEDFYYSLNAPAKGGPALHRLPKQRGGTVVLTKAPPKHYEPPPIRPVIHPALPGEGVWH